MLIDEKHNAREKIEEVLIDLEEPITLLNYLFEISDSKEGT